MLIDGHSIAYRAFFALPVENFSTQTGQHTNGVFGFTSMLINVLRDEKPTHLGVAFDVSRHTFRSEIYREYKANRTTTPDEFKGQLDLVKEVLKALNIPYVEKEGFEADDVIGTLATQAEAAGFEVLICTGDRDAFQLVSDNVTVLYPRKGVSDLARMTPKAVEERYFATPARYPDLAALVGESSDNLPGVPGVGPKTAAKWLEMYGGLEDLAAHASELKGKAAEAFQVRVDDVLRNRQVNRLVCDLDLPLGDVPGTVRRLISSSMAWSFGCYATGCSRPCPTKTRWWQKVASTWMRHGWSLESLAAGSPITQRVSAPVSTSSVIGALGPATLQPSRWLLPMAPQRTWWCLSSVRLMRTRSRVGLPIPNTTRRCTTPRARSWLSGRAVGISPA
jgi:5'-3' exonuclease